MFNSYRLTLRCQPVMIMLALIGFILFGVTNSGFAQDIAQDTTVKNNNNLGTDLWKAVRQNSLPIESRVDSDGTGAIYTDGMTWLKFRDQKLIPMTGYIMGGTLLAILLFWLIRRSIKIPGGESGNRIQRTSTYERVLHWTMALVFVFLAISGFIVMYGRPLIIPLVGIEAYGLVAAASKTLHNLFGLVFPLTIVLMFFQFVSRNIYEKGDFIWLLKGGGFFGKSHPSAGYYNMGEKILFWLVMLFGLLISASGLIMVFQLFQLTRTEMILLNTAHGIIAAAYLVLIMGHIYLATAGVKGTLSAMTEGSVDANWAKAHHDRWYEQVQSIKDI